MPGRYVSAPLLKMLQAAGIAPSAVQRAVARQVEKRSYPVLRAGHAYVDQVSGATRLNITGIAWRYGRLLVDIEQIKEQRIHWFYREFKGSYCSFRYPTQIPQTVVGGLRGRPLSLVIDTIAPLADVLIAGVDEEYPSAGWVNLKLSPEWISF